MAPEAPPRSRSTTERWDLIVVGTGFASAFFLHEYLGRAPARARVLVLEKGDHRSHAWQLEHPDAWRQEAARAIVNATPRKPWQFTLGLGGGSNCWWASTPRMLPADFELGSRYGVGRDWPISYAELEPYYSEAETLMQVAGPSDDAPCPRSRPYPQPPHQLSEAEELLRGAFPGQLYHQPAARPTRPTPTGRPACCGSGVCTLCPIDSKFTVLNEMGHLFRDPRVTLTLRASVQAVETEAGAASGVVYLQDGREHTARGSAVALGANGIFNAHILLRSGLGGCCAGRGLVEQTVVPVRVALDRFLRMGSTSITGHGYMFYDGPHRRERAAALVETTSLPTLLLRGGRLVPGLLVKFLLEDLPGADSTVRVSPEDPTRPVVEFRGPSEYTQRALARVPEYANRLASALPVREVQILPPSPTEAHILATTVMGRDPDQSVVDRHLIHHRVRNLVVLGSGAFPTTAPVNPTLTLCALALWSARHLVAS